jgi:hypothetical protein
LGEVEDAWRGSSKQKADQRATGRTIMSKWIAAVAAAVLIAGGGSYAVFLAATPPAAMHPVASRPVWTESTWPFLIDQWGQGWAYQCKAADCGIDVDLYLRPKLGFCNCQTGVADDEELDRVSDLDLVGSERSALGPGRPIMVQFMKGRSRGYKVGAASAKAVLSLAFNNRCDVIVATVVAGDKPVAQEQAVLEFLNGDLMLHWAEAVLGL